MTVAPVALAAPDARNDPQAPCHLPRCRNARPDFRVDTIPEAPAKFGALEFIVTGGGMAANAAVAVKRLGARRSTGAALVMMMSATGSCASLSAKGRCIARVSPARCPLKTSAILVDNRGERLICSAPPRLSSRHIMASARWGATRRRRTCRFALETGRPPCLMRRQQPGIQACFDADAGDPEEVLTIARRATHPVFSEPMLKSLGFGAPDVAIPRAFGGRNVICGVTLGERGTWWFDGQRLQLTPARRCMRLTPWAPAIPGTARWPLRWPRSSRSVTRCSSPPTWQHSNARGLAGAMASPPRDEVNAFRANFLLIGG